MFFVEILILLYTVQYLEMVLFLLRALCVSIFKVRNIRPKIIHFETGHTRNKKFYFDASKKQRTVEKCRQKCILYVSIKQIKFKAYNQEN
jgi:hypothetical protein